MGIPTWTMYASHFNSRPRMRANHSRASVICIFGYFNSRPRMRANGDRLLKYRSPLIFQLPPSHEGEHGMRRQNVKYIYFNSRPRMRANAAVAAAWSAYAISTPALA